MAKTAQIAVEKVKDIQIVTVLAVDLWDRGVIQAVRDDVVALFDNQKPPKVILDLNRVARFSSEGINALLRIRDHASGQNCELALCDLQPTVAEVIKIVGLDRLFKIYKNRWQAFQGLSPQAE